MKKAICWGLFLLISLNLSAESKRDSLINILQNQQIDNKEKLAIYYKLTSAHFSIDSEPVPFCDYAHKGLELAKKEKDIVKQSWFHGCLADCCRNEGNKELNLYHLEKGLEFAIESDDLTMLIVSYNQMGVFYLFRGMHEKAIEYYLKGLECSERSGQKQYISTYYSNLVGVYRNLANYERAMYYLEKNREICEEIGHERGLMDIYYELGRIKSYFKEQEEALKFTQQSLALSYKLKDKQYEILNLQALVAIYSGMREFKKAEEYAEKSLEVALEHGEHRLILYAWVALSDAYFSYGNFKACDVAATNAWEMDSTNASHSAGLAYNLSYANAFMGNAKKSMKFAKIYKDLSKKKSNENYQIALADMEVKYETEKKELKIVSLEREKQLYIWIGVGGVLFLISMVFVLLLTLRNAKKEKQLVATRSVMDGEMKERMRLARDLHDRLSGNLSAVKIGLTDDMKSAKSVGEKLDSCIEEVRQVAHNLMPTSLQYGLKTALEDFAAQFPNVQFHFFGKEIRFDERAEFALYCCASELVNNSLRHAEAKTINLQLVLQKDYASLTVQDDGKGYEKPLKTEGIGLQNVRDRVASCNGKMDVVSSPGEGTETIIELKIRMVNRLNSVS